MMICATTLRPGNCCARFASERERERPRPVYRARIYPAPLSLYISLALLPSSRTSARGQVCECPRFWWCLTTVPATLASFRGNRCSRTLIYIYSYFYIYMCVMCRSSTLLFSSPRVTATVSVGARAAYNNGRPSERACLRGTSGGTSSLRRATANSLALSL